MAAATPTPMATPDPVFEECFRELAQHLREKATAVESTGQRKYFRPERWEGNPFNYEAIAEAFLRDKVNSDWIKAISDPANPGTTGDEVACANMIDLLSTMERAFHMRHTMRRCRATAHTVGRMKGMGAEKGTVVQLTIEYVRSIMRQAAKK